MSNRLPWARRDDPRWLDVGRGGNPRGIAASMTGRVRNAPSPWRRRSSLDPIDVEKGVGDEAGSHGWAYVSGACGLRRSAGRALTWAETPRWRCSTAKVTRTASAVRNCPPTGSGRPPSARAWADPPGTTAPPLPRLHDHNGLSRRRPRTRRPRRRGSELAATGKTRSVDAAVGRVSEKTSRWPRRPAVMEAPLHYRIRPRALRLVSPERPVVHRRFPPGS